MQRRDNTIPEFLQRPVMRGAILGILDLDSDDGFRERPAGVAALGRQQVRGQRGVESVRQQHKLELDLQRNIAECY